jgi:hypothetical protein
MIPPIPSDAGGILLEDATDIGFRSPAFQSSSGRPVRAGSFTVDSAPVQTLPDVRRPVASSAGIDSPKGVFRRREVKENIVEPVKPGNACNLLSKCETRPDFMYEVRDIWPKMSFVSLSEPSARRAERLAWA